MNFNYIFKFKHTLCCLLKNKNKNKGKLNYHSGNLFIFFFFLCPENLVDAIFENGFMFKDDGNGKISISIQETFSLHLPDSSVENQHLDYSNVSV